LRPSDVTTSDGTTGGLVLVVTSPRVAPGLLSMQAWDVLRSIPVHVVGSSHPILPVLRAAGVDVEVIGLADVPMLVPTAADTPIAVVAEPAAEDDLRRVVTEALAEREAHGSVTPQVETVVGSHDLPGARLLDLVAVMDRLRSPGGCPWDAQQTHRSLATYLVEETYETLEAIETGDDADLREELGDLLLQVVFNARIAEERDSEAWSIDDVAAGLVDKLVRRHPHVFADADASTPAHVEARWELLKRAEKKRGSAMEGVPLAQPALSLATKLRHRAEKAGVRVPEPTVAAPPVADADDVGETLMAVVAAAGSIGVDPEQALRDATRRFVAQIRAAEQEQQG
jgi:XTP/dITP diphosphohydrolase